MMKPEYDPAKNYIALHLTWLKRHPTFIPKHVVKSNHEMSWYDILTEIYGDESRPMDLRNHIACNFLFDDLKWFDEYYKQIKEFITPSNNEGKWFVTIGFNHQTFDAKNVKEFILNLFTLKFVDSESYGVFEYYRANGEHPHIHICLKTDVKTKSQIVQQIFRSKYAKVFILNKCFIDVKTFEDHHVDYLKGNKKADKLEFCEQDKQWRLQHNYPDVFRASI